MTVATTELGWSRRTYRTCPLYSVVKDPARHTAFLGGAETSASSRTQSTKNPRPLPVTCVELHRSRGTAPLGFPLARRLVPYVLVKRSPIIPNPPWSVNSFFGVRPRLFLYTPASEWLNVRKPPTAPGAGGCRAGVRCREGLGAAAGTRVREFADGVDPGAGGGGRLGGLGPGHQEGIEAGGDGGAGFGEGFQRLQQGGAEAVPIADAVAGGRRGARDEPREEVIVGPGGADGGEGAAGDCSSLLAKAVVVGCWLAGGEPVCAGAADLRGL